VGWEEDWELEGSLRRGCDASEGMVDGGYAVGEGLMGGVVVEALALNQS